MSCNCMMRTSQQECRGILESYILIFTNSDKNYVSRETFVVYYNL